MVDGSWKGVMVRCRDATGGCNLWMQDGGMQGDWYID